MVLSGVDIRVLVHEMKDVVEKAWIDNIYEIPGKIFIFKLRQPQVGKIYLLVEPGKRIHLTTFNREMPKEPTNFAKTLRSHLRNKMINSIQQKDIDRIVKLDIGPEPSYKLVFELFGEGNIILISPDGKIVTALRFRKMKDRDIHPGKVFREMPPQERDIIRNGVDDLEIYLENNHTLVPALNNWLGMGPYYSRYILKEVGIDKKKTNELNPSEIEQIRSFTKKLHKRLLDHEYNPIVYLEQEQTTDKEEDGLDYDDQWGDDALPFKPENVVKILPWSQPVPDSEELIKFDIDNLWKAYDIFYSSQESQEVVDGESETLETHVEKLEHQLEEQQKHKQRLEKMAEIYQNYGDALYANFKAADELISTVYTAKKNNVDWETIQSKLEDGKKKGMKAAQIFDKINPDKAKMFLNLPFDGDTYDVTVDFRQSLTENANDYFEKAKKSKKKAEGAEKAIKNTKERISKAEEEVREKLESKRERVVVLKRRRGWYEKFHWTITPNETLVIGGYDASSNEKLVKRYLEGEDLFVHADLTGASAVVIKSQESGINKIDKEIASQIAVSYSSGWKAKLPVADAFVVTSEQVSLTPPSGEYLPKGSFMIYGEKDYVKNLPLELSIGVVIERHWAKIIAGPENCMEKSSFYCKIMPGENSRGKLAKQIQSRFANMGDDIEAQKIEALDSSEIAWHIPGDSKIVDFYTT